MSLPLADAHVVVTGGTGFVGSHVVPLLHDLGAQVTVVAPGPGWREPLRTMILSGDVRLLAVRAWWTKRAADRIAREAGRVDHLLHLAYQLPVGPPAERTRREVRCNELGVVELVAALSDELSHVCFTSSVKVYGTSETSPLSESTRPHPVDPYGAAKLAAEDQLRILASAGGPRSTVLRLSTLYGPMELVPRAVPTFIRAALAGRPMHVRGPGTELRDYLHVRDAAMAMVKALQQAPDEHRLVNVGSGTGTSTYDMALRVHRLVTGHDPQDRPTALHRTSHRPDADYVCAVDKARTELGFDAQVDLDGGLLEEIAWFASRPHL